jgi:hypothetical protein
MLPDGYMVTAAYYSPMSKALIEFRGKFTTLWDLLTTFVDFPTPPLRSNSHTTGILSTFLDIIPFDHGNKLYKSMDKEQIKAMRDIKSDFFPVFYSKVREIMKESNKIKDLNNTLDMHYTSTKKDHNKAFKDRPKSLSYSTLLDSHEYENDYQSIENNENENDYKNIKNNENEKHNEIHNNKEVLSEFDKSDTLFSLSYSSMSEMPSLSRLDSNKTILPCFSMLRTGKCLKADKCNFSHNKSDLISAWQAMFNDLKSSPFNPNKHLLPSPDPSWHSSLHNSPAPVSTISSPPLSLVSSDLATTE